MHLTVAWASKPKQDVVEAADVAQTRCKRAWNPTLYLRILSTPVDSNAALNPAGKSANAIDW